VTYDDALRWLLTLPDFERTGDFADRPDIGPMLALLRELGDPHLGRASIHIAGSKGKGSTGAMIEAVPRAAGLSTGHYISPHLHRWNERIRLAGQPIAPEGFAVAMEQVRPALERVAAQFPERQLLAFDALTAAAFVAFREADVAAQIIEVGLGGLLDSTNVFHAQSDEPTPHVVVLTPVSLEHTAILGDTIPKIAAQKAGVITEDCTVVVAPQRESALDVFNETARDRHATLIGVAKSCQLERKSANADGQDFRLKTPRATYAAHLPLAGRHQLDNAATAVLACEELCDRAGVELTEPQVRAGLASFLWPARLETLKRKPWVIIDGAHNGDSVKSMAAAVRDDFGLRSAVLLFGTVAGKDVAAMVQAAAPITASVFVTSWPSARAMDPHDAARAFRDAGGMVTTFSSLPDAYEAAVTEAGERGAVVAFGSLAFVAAVREYVLGIESDAMRLAVPQ